MQQLRSRFAVQAVVLGDRTAECEMVEDAMSQWKEMSDTTAVNAEDANVAVDALADMARARKPLTTGRFESTAEASNAQADGESEILDDLDEQEDVAEHYSTK